jgi:hypothetical protein
MGIERMRAPEIVFQPSMMGIDQVKPKLPALPQRLSV